MNPYTGLLKLEIVFQSFFGVESLWSIHAEAISVRKADSRVETVYILYAAAPATDPIASVLI